MHSRLAADQCCSFGLAVNVGLAREVVGGESRSQNAIYKEPRQNREWVERDLRAFAAI